MDKAKRGNKTILYLYLLLSFLYFVSYITRLSFSATMTEMISAGVLDKEQAGLVGSALFFAYALGQIVSGLLGDRFSPYGIVGMGPRRSCRSIALYRRRCGNDGWSLVKLPFLCNAVYKAVQ